MAPTEFIGIYDADSTLSGEISYWINARLGRTHCSLCELTHGVFTRKSEWTNCVESLEIPFTTFHRNDAPADALDAAQGNFPIVLARINSQLVIAFTAHQLDSFNGDTHLFEAELAKYLEDL